VRPEHLRLDRLASPIGEVLLVTDEAGRLRALDFHDYEPRMLRLLRLHYGDARLETGAAPAAIRAALDAYFAGQLTALTAIPWATAGTDFQRQVWNALVDVPVGQTVTYAGLAARIGRPTAVRALGAANGANPVGIVVPCHRVIGTDGALTGYGGGIARKRWLLAHEGAASVVSPRRTRKMAALPLRR
jgi:methylated-DNA-[protein]-cysteine S-methyltransferase